MQSSRSAVLFCALMATVPARASLNLISNGDFLTGNPITATPGAFLTLGTGDTSLAQWTVTGSADWIGSYWSAPKSNGSPGGGSVDLDGYKAVGRISQAVNTVANDSYTLSFYMSGNPDGLPKLKNLLVTVDGSQLSYFPAADISAWTLENYVFTASTTETTISFESTDTAPVVPNPYGLSYGPVVAGVSLTPEPGFYGVLGLGISGLAFFIRRRTV